MKKVKQLDLYIIGTGVIGGELLSQIKKQQKIFLKQREIRLKVVCIADIYKMVVNSKGIDLRNVESLLKNGKETDVALLLNFQISPSANKSDIKRSVLVDCTASQKIADMYPKFLKAGFAVVTPNKKANSGTFATYKKLQKVQSAKDTKFLYETNVGAGLPIIKTIQNLIVAGDEIQKIEAVLSGTLSYIFNTYDGSKPFSEIVRMAKEKGYTEPDPRDDLSGLDVARKLLILGRELGHSWELSDIDVPSLLSKKCMQAETIEDFFKVLSKEDEKFAKKSQKALKEDKRLRYVASITNKRGKISLKEVDQSHPFFNLAGTDNIIAIWSTYYNNTPLVIKGPGAGAKVTAAGVFADILSLAN